MWRTGPSIQPRPWVAVSVGVVLALASAAPAAAQVVKMDGLPEVGSKVQWSYADRTSSMAPHNELTVYRGPDFVIYYEVDGPTDFIPFSVEFSGILFLSCDDEMPDEASRKKLATLLPLEPGKTVTLEKPAVTVTTKSEVKTYRPNAGYETAYMVRSEFADWDETILVSSDPVATIATYSDGFFSVSTKLPNADPTELPDMDNLVALQNCATLL